MIKTPLDLLELLLSRLTRGQQVPALLDGFLQARLRQNPALAESPLTEFLADGADFLSFLQGQWLNFLAAQQPPAAEIDTALEPEALAFIENPKTQVVGLVVNTVDNISHGMQLGTAGMHQQVKLWTTQHRYLTRLVHKLLDELFTVYLTADHGNVWAQGIGRPNEGTLVETRGQRARIYTDPAFLDLARQQLPEAIEWSNIGLPPGLQVLLAPKLNAFLNVGEQAVCHGGIALEEVIVPFVQISNKEDVV